jgi:hypothetical protein
LVFNIVDGKIEGGTYDCVTFYDVTTSDGLIERDAFGNPTSPLLDGETATVSSTYGLSIQEPIPTISQWGLVIMALLMLVAGTVIIRRRLRPVPEIN